MPSHRSLSNHLVCPVIVFAFSMVHRDRLPHRLQGSRHGIWDFASGMQARRYHPAETSSLY